jgi:hypothetical protein
MTQSLASGELGKVDIELECGSTIKTESHTGKSMRRTLDEVTELARTKNPVASSGLLKERASAQLQLGPSGSDLALKAPEVSEVLCLGPVYYSSCGSDFAKAR